MQTVVKPIAAQIVLPRPAYVDEHVPLIEVAPATRARTVVVEADDLRAVFHAGDDVLQARAFDAKDARVGIVAVRVELVEGRCVIIVAVAREGLIALMVDRAVVTVLIDRAEKREQVVVNIYDRTQKITGRVHREETNEGGGETDAE